MISFMLYGFVLAVVATVSYGCSCKYPEHMMFPYCPTDYVIRATVLSREGPYLPDDLLAEIPVEEQSYFIENYGINTYELKTINMISVNAKYHNVALDHLFIYEGSALCGVSLDVNTTYILSGRVVDGLEGIMLTTTSCNFPTPISPDVELPGNLKNLKCDDFTEVWAERGLQPNTPSKKRNFRDMYETALRNLK